VENVQGVGNVLGNKGAVAIGLSIASQPRPARCGSSGEEEATSPLLCAEAAAAWGERAFPHCLRPLWLEFAYIYAAWSCKNRVETPGADQLSRQLLAAAPAGAESGWWDTPTSADDDGPSLCGRRVWVAGVGASRTESSRSESWR
jgi:hypothetical protein